MTEKSRQTWKRVIDIVITVLTALVTAITTQSCI